MNDLKKESEYVFDEYLKEASWTTSVCGSPTLLVWKEGCFRDFPFER